MLGTCVKKTGKNDNSNIYYKNINAESYIHNKHSHHRDSGKQWVRVEVSTDEKANRAHR